MNRLGLILLALFAFGIVAGCGEETQQTAAMDAQKKIDEENKARGNNEQE